MKNANHLILATCYLLLVIFSEIGLFYLAELMPTITISDYSMLLMLAVFMGVAWMLKPRMPAVTIIVVLIALYGILSFYSNFSIYYVGYPASINDFVIVIAVKTAYYSFPVIAYVVISKK